MNLLNKKVKRALSRLTAIASREGHELKVWSRKWPRTTTWQTSCKHCSSYIFLFTDENGDPKRHYRGLYSCQSNFIFKEDYDYRYMNKCSGREWDDKIEKQRKIRLKRLIPIAQTFLDSRVQTSTVLARLLYEGTNLLSIDDIESDEIEAGIMKKTTQRSPEWTGGANC